MKKCNKCEEKKDLLEFGKHARHSDGLSSWCKKCISSSKKTKEYRDRENEVRRKKYKETSAQILRDRSRKYRSTESGRSYTKNYNLKRYGISLEKYNSMLKAQDGKCAICFTHESQLKRTLSVDHDHSNGKVRSLLCHGCNTSLGGFKESTEILSRAISYLERHRL